MDKRPNSAVLADQGLALWEQGKLEEARVCYVKALAAADQDYFRMPDYHAQYAGVLSALDENEAAEEQYNLAIEAELRQADDPNGNSVVVARYFRANHLLSKGKAQDALDSISAYVNSAAGCKWLLLSVQAESLQALGRLEEARKSGIAAAQSAPSNEKRSELIGIFIESGILKECDA